jgi:hypothetical protein
MQTDIRVPEGEALGVVIDGERGVIYGPGRHEVHPVTADGYYKSDAEWWTVRFSTDRSTVRWQDVRDDVETNAIIGVSVTAPTAVWQRTPNPEQPVASLLETIIEDAIDDGVAPGDLTPRLIHEHAPEEWGLQVHNLVTKQWRVREYELETVDSQFVTIEVMDDVTGADDSSLADEGTAPAVLRDALAEATDDPETVTSLDPNTINECIDRESTLQVRTVAATTERAD